MADAIQEYLYLLKPKVDKNSWEKAFGEIDILGMKKSENVLKQKTGLEEKIQKLKESIKVSQEADLKLIAGGEKLGKGGSATTVKLTEELNQATAQLEAIPKESIEAAESMKKAAALGQSVISSAHGLLGLLTSAINTAQKLLDTSTEFSNKFVTSGSAFVNTNIRNKMLNYGVSSSTAQSISAAEGALGISASDYALLTQGQRDAFDELMGHYQKGIEKINTDKLDAFNESIQEYQLRWAEFNMDIELAFMRIFAESEPIQRLADTVMGFFESLAGILSSPAVQFGFDIFVEFLDSLISILSAPFKLFGGNLFGSGGTSNTTNNTYNYNNYGGGTTTKSNPAYIQYASKQ